jgi:hypothetical protein
VNTGRQIRVGIVGPSRVERILREVEIELGRACRKFAAMHSPHEGVSVIHEEFRELRDHVYGDTGRGREAREEAIQLAAMAVRYVIDLCDEAGPT